MSETDLQNLVRRYEEAKVARDEARKVLEEATKVLANLTAQVLDTLDPEEPIAPRIRPSGREGKKYTYGEKTRAVLSVLAERDRARPREIASITGLSQNQVQTVLTNCMSYATPWVMRHRKTRPNGPAYYSITQAGLASLADPKEPNNGN